MEPILVATCAFLLENKAAIASSIIASASYETIKKTLNLSGLKSRIAKFFISDEQIEEYVKKNLKIHINLHEILKIHMKILQVWNIVLNYSMK